MIHLQNILNMRVERVRLVMIFTLFLTLTSCSSIVTALYGIKQPVAVKEHTIVKYAKKYNIPVSDNYVLDTAYFSYLFSLDSIKFKAQIKNHYQPLQALYYDDSGHLCSFQINCYAGGFPNLKWNRNNIMTTFPPKQQAPIDSIVGLQTQLKFLKPILPAVGPSINNCDYIVIVYWNKFMGRQSKRLIRIIQKNAKLESKKRVKIIYVNNDNIFSR